MLVRCAVMATAVMIGYGFPLHAQQDRVWSAEIVGLAYETGNQINCGTGIGFGLDIERQTPLRYVSVVGGVRMADAPACTDVGSIRIVHGRHFNEANHLSLLAAPLLGVALGPDASTLPLPIAPRVRLGLLAARIDAPKDERHLMPLAQAELHARYRRFAILVRTGAIRAPVLLQSSDSGQYETFMRQWHWRRMFEAGARLHW